MISRILYSGKRQETLHKMKIKKYFTALKRFICDPDYRFLLKAGIGRYDSMPDREYIIKKFRASMGYEPDLDEPKTFNEKLQWLKLYDRRPEYTVMADKFLAREYIENKLGNEYLIPLIGVWDDPDEIDFKSLPEKFVLKCNHNSGLGMYICRDKAELNEKKVRNALRRGLKQDYYLCGREWPYKNIPRKIICEKYMTDSPESSDFTDYKFFCFDGKADCVMLCLERSSGDTKFYFFDRDWNLKRYNIRGKNAPDGFTLPKPDNIDKMFEIASVLSEDLPFARIDLYNSDGHIYFGEITFYPDSGFDPNLLKETDEYFGNLIKLPERK